MPKSVPLPTFPLSGLVPLEKPSGPTSMRIIDYIKPLLAESPLFHSPEATSRAAIKAEVKKLMKHRGGLKIGQGGTLDPLADGVLVIGVNKGTKQLGQFLHCTKVCRSSCFQVVADASQTYTTTALLGSCTTTYDSEGPILSTAPWAHVTREVIEQALEKFRGDIMQVPPM
jgi:tRNA pseudouridine55 synthase